MLELVKIMKLFLLFLHCIENCHMSKCQLHFMVSFINFFNLIQSMSVSFDVIINIIKILTCDMVLISCQSCDVVILDNQNLIC